MRFYNRQKCEEFYFLGNVTGRLTLLWQEICSDQIVFDFRLNQEVEG